MNDIDDAEARLRRAASASAAASAAPDLHPAIVTGAPDRRAPRLVHHGRAARGVGASLTAVAAVSIGALVVPALVPRAPLFTAATAVAPATGLETDAASSDSMFAWWVEYRYVAGSGLSTEGGHGTVYQLKRVGDPEAVLADAAAALGLAGEPAESTYATPDYPLYVVGPEDGSGPSASLGWMGTGNWWYIDPAAYPEPVCTEAPVESGQPGETLQDYCDQPEIPASESKAPSEAEARERAAAIFEATGLDVEPSDIRVIVDPWQTLASANLVVDGTTTALEYDVAWSPLGEISWATGHSVEVVERGDFDTVSPVVAVDRFGEGRWYGAAGPDFSGGMIAYADAGVARELDTSTSSEEDEASVSSPAPTAPSEPADPGDPGVVLAEP
ncbi:MAG: hypothetical protein QM675_12490, partial [Protaetiibacter sp.]